MRIKVDLKYLFHGSPDAQTAPDTPQTLSSFGQELTPQEIEDRLRTLLMSGDPDYEQLREWFCAVFGGECENPKDSYPTTPDCAGETPAACTQAFRDAGFSGDITTQTLSGDLAQMEQDPGRVTNTRPQADLEIAQGHDIIIYVNPDPLPTMTATDTSIANTLQTQNPETVDETNKKTLAITCRKLTEAAGRSSSDCLSLPIFVVGKEIHVPAENDLAGLVRNPSWVALNARDKTNAVGPRQWHQNRGTPEPGCLTSEKFPANADCDEFPYWSNLQTHNGTLSTLTPSIRWSPRQENRFEGAALAQFYSNNNPGPKMHFHGCDITQQDALDVLPVPSSTFLVLPLPGLPFPTTGMQQAVTRILTGDLLDEFDDALRWIGAAITEIWKPGLSDDEIDALTQPLGLQLPEEARKWWRWHNGFSPEVRAPRWDITPNRPLFDLQMTLDDFESSREAVLQLEGATARLSPVGNVPWIFFDCEGARDAPVPIYVGDHGYGQQLVLPSIGELVAVWIDLIRTGVYTTDANGNWQGDVEERCPPEILKLGVF